MKSIQIISKDLFDKVRSRFTNLEMGDETGAVTIDPAEARFFDFDFVVEGNNLGRVSMSLNDLGILKVYYSQGITENQDGPAKKEWFDFLKEMRMFAMRRLLRFDTRDISKNNLDKNDFQHLAKTQPPKEEEQAMNESRWNNKSSRKTSRAVRGNTEVIVRHAKPVEETYPGARSQRKNIKAIFIQNRDGERYKYPFIHTAGAFAMAQHVDHGGVPHDAAGKHIIRMSEQIAQLQEFQRQVRQPSLHSEAHGITERAIGRLQELKTQIASLGQRNYYESWAETFNQSAGEPELLELDAVAMEQYKNKFTETNFKEELAAFFPLIHSIMQEQDSIDLEEYVGETWKGSLAGGVAGKIAGGALGSAIAPGVGTVAGEIIGSQIGSKIGDALSNVGTNDEDKTEGMDAFEQWAEAVEQGKLTPDQIDNLKQAVSDLKTSGNPQPLGDHGQAAWEFFNGAAAPDSDVDVFSDDLHRKFEVAAEEFPDTDALEVFTSWAEESYPELLVALGMSGSESEPAAEPAPAAEQPPVAEVDDGFPNTMMPKESHDPKALIKEVAKIVKSFYNRDNPEVGPFRGGEGIAIDVEKSCTEKFGEAAGHQARQMAEAFMEKLTMEWQDRHGQVDSVDDDGLARLKELVGNIKSKVESIGDVGGHPGKNIMSAESDEPEKPTDSKQRDINKKWRDEARAASKQGHQWTPTDLPNYVGQVKKAYYKDKGVGEAQDSNFIGFMNKALGQKADAPADTSTDPDFMKGAPLASLDSWGYKAALNFGMKTLTKLTPTQKIKLAIKGEDGVVNWLAGQAKKQGLLITGEDTEENQSKFRQEDLDEVQDFLPEVFHDPAIKSWAFVLTDGEPLPKTPVAGPFSVSINPGIPGNKGYANADWKTVDTLENLPDAKELAKGLAQRNPKQYVGIWTDDGKSAGFYQPSKGWSGMDEGIGDTIKRGVKSVKRAAQGWGRDELPITGSANKPKDVVARNKSYDVDTAKKMRAGLDDAPEHSPAGLQKRVLDRKLKGVAEAADSELDSILRLSGLNK